MVEEAGSAEQALELPPLAFDVLVTDVILPGMSGRALAERLCERNRALKTVFMSGYAGEEIERSLPLVDGTRFPQKPFTPVTLARAVRHVLDGEGISARR